MHSDSDTPDVAIPIVQDDVTIDESSIDATTSSVTQTKIGTFHIIDSIITDPPTKIQKNHLTRNIIDELTEDRKIRDVEIKLLIYDAICMLHLFN